MIEIDTEITAVAAVAATTAKRRRCLSKPFPFLSLHPSPLKPPPTAISYPFHFRRRLHKNLYSNYIRDDRHWWNERTGGGRRKIRFACVNNVFRVTKEVLNSSLFSYFFISHTDNQQLESTVVKKKKNSKWTFSTGGRQIPLYAFNNEWTLCAQRSCWVIFCFLGQHFFFNLPFSCI